MRTKPTRFRAGSNSRPAGETVRVCARAHAGAVVD